MSAGSYIDGEATASGGDRRAALLADLNPEQAAAVTHAGGPLLVIAGAGSGKTRVLTRRLAWLAAGGLPARSLLAITFTNKAAQVLKERLRDLAAALGTGEPWAGTFHGFGAWLLRRWGENVGISRDFTIIDREDQQRLLRDIVHDLAVPGAPTPADLAAALSHGKNLAGGRAPMDLDAPGFREVFERIAAAYAERTRRGSLLDFDDLLLESVRLLRTSPEAAEAVRRRFAHVLVDEYQDTNLVQRDLLFEVLGGRGAVTVVGDPDQSIYRWRGAAIRNILDFADQVPGTTTIALERNYRSTAKILRAAEAVIARNRDRYEKRLWTENDEGEDLRVVRCREGEQEAQVVARLVEDWRAAGRRLGEVAVFYRVNAFSRGLELAFRGRGIPYRIVAGVEFFQRKEVKDVLAYARLLENPRDDAAFLRVANVPARGIGDRSLQRIRLAAQARGVSCLEAARGDVDGLSGPARKGLGDLLAFLRTMEGLRHVGVADLLDLLANRSGYVASLADAGAAFGEGRAENVEALVAHAREMQAKDPSLSLGGFLEGTALVSDQDAYEEQRDRVNLMSVHAAKGLEFPFVVIAGAESEWFPHRRSFGDAESEEEERRLFYVAMTRAMERLAVTWARERVSYAGAAPRHATPYLDDVPKDVVVVEDRTGYPAPRTRSREGERARGPDEEDALDGVSFVRESPGGALAPGARVRHPLFGDGWLRDRRGTGTEVRVTVDFDAYGEKTLMLKYANLEPVR